MTTTSVRGHLLGLALLCCLPALAGAQQFRVERDFDLLRDARGTPLRNNYLVSLPLNPVIPDAGNKSATAPGYRSRCVGDPFGPTAGDGVIDSLDLICAWWTARANPATAGSFSIVWWDPQNCMPVATSAALGFGNVMWISQVFPFDPNVGHRVIVGVPTGASYSPRNHVVLEGDGEPQWPGVDVFASTTCHPLSARGAMLNFPYDAAYTEAAEIACGLRGVDWFDADADADGRPDTCWDDADGDGRYDAGEAPTGLYDGRHALVVNRMLNSAAAQGYDPFIVAPGFRGRVNVAGSNYALEAGQAYWVELSLAHVTTHWDPPLR